MKTIRKKYGPCEYKEKGSRFISFVFSVKNSDDVKKHIANLKKEFHNSTHICYAYRLIEDSKEYYRYNDDGEPSGTAGLPILNEIKASGLFNVLVTVIRYYGGVKLGKGGLIRAYGGTAKKVIEISKKVDFYINEEIILKIPFEIIGKTLNIIGKNKTYKIIKNIQTETGIRLKILLPKDDIPNFTNLLKDISSGKIDIYKDYLW